MPVWPFLMALSAGLTLWGWRVNAWHVPALSLLGYVGMRGIIWGMPAEVHEVAGCTWWICVCALMAMKGGHVPAFFYALSAMTYPMLLIFGFRMEYMGLSPIISECFAALALLSIGGGLYGLERHSGADSGGVRPVGRFVAYSVPVAFRKADPTRSPEQG